jgi:hypothetical protein
MPGLTHSPGGMKYGVKRRLQKLGFSSQNLKSKEAFFTRWGEITVGQIPEKISFNEVASHPWSKPSEYADSQAAFESLGFRRTGTFIASPQRWVVEFWINNECGLLATIGDSPGLRIRSEEPRNRSTACWDRGTTRRDSRCMKPVPTSHSTNSSRKR